MTTVLQIEPVPRSRWRSAIRFLAGGDTRDYSTRERARGIEELIRSRGPDRVHLWWGRKRRRPLAVGMVLESPGRTGMLFYCPLSEPGVNLDALVSVVQAIGRDGIGRGLCFVQALVPPEIPEDVVMLRRGGYEKLAELVYMRLELEGYRYSDEKPELVWREYDRFDESELIELVDTTYVDSLDCPRMRPVRSAADAVTAHKHTALFTPQSWWIVNYDGRGAGCVLMNDSETSNTCEIVYIGVAPPFRRRGIARAMLRRAAHIAWTQGRTALTLAVDSRNTHATGLYESEGFVVTDRRLSYAILNTSDSYKQT